METISALAVTHWIELVLIGKYLHYLYAMTKEHSPRQHWLPHRNLTSNLTPFRKYRYYIGLRCCYSPAPTKLQRLYILGCSQTPHLSTYPVSRTYSINIAKSYQTLWLHMTHLLPLPAMKLVCIYLRYWIVFDSGWGRKKHWVSCWTLGYDEVSDRLSQSF